MKNIHPLQSKKWGEFREKTRVKVVYSNNFVLTIHSIPKTKYTIGYFPKGEMPTKKLLDKLLEIGKKENSIFIQIEPNIENSEKEQKNLKNLGLVKSAHPLFTKNNLVLNITKSEDELLSSFSQKTRYNIRLAQKKGVEVRENSSDQAFQKYLEITKETTQRQKFYAHTPTYHKLMWETLREKNDELTAHLLTAKYGGEIIVTWILFVSGDTLYYPYGASSSKHREVMASNLMMWEAIKFGKRLGLKKFDLWGSLGENPDIKDPWYGFHKFKLGYNPKSVEYVGSFDFVINQFMYHVYKTADKIRWTILKMKK